MAVKKSSTVKPDEKPAKATMLVKTEKLKAVAVKNPAEVQAAPKPEEKAIQVKSEPIAPEVEVIAVKETIKTTAPETEHVKTPETPKAETKAEAKKETDPNKEFVDGIMADMSLKGASKKRLIRMLAEQYGMDKQKVMFRLKRALITERYAAMHEAGH